MFRSVKHVRVSDDIINQVKNLISDGKLKPGDRLPSERDLIKEFGVSRPSLREALNSLATMGLLETKAKRKYIRPVTSQWVQDPLSVLIKTDTEKIFDLIEVRKAMETWNASLAAQRASDGDIKGLAVIIEEMKRAFDEGKSWEKEDADFHLALAQATHNTIQTHMMSTIYELLRESIARVFTDRGKLKKLLHQHGRIFNAIKNRSPEKARERTLEHLNYVESEVKAFTGLKRPS